MQDLEAERADSSQGPAGARRKVQEEGAHGWKPGGSLAGTFFPLCALNALKVMEPCLAWGFVGAQEAELHLLPQLP